MIVECPGCKSHYDVSGRPSGTRARCRCGTSFVLPDPPDQAGLLACPVCGAPVPPTNHTCEHCRTQLLVRACPRCFARVFHGARHCSHCGAETAAPAAADPDGNATARRCPRCDQHLIGRLVSDVLLDECDGCGGVFVDAAALERILKERRQARADALLGAIPRAELAPPSGDGPVYVKCPDCSTLMNRRAFARGAGVVVDVCRQHGTWFDAGELPRVIEFAMDGGLERAAADEAEQRRQEARRLETERRKSQIVIAASDAEADRGRKLSNLIDLIRELFWW